MKETDLGKAVLLLADGTAFHGKAAGRKGISTGEICFNTGMTGYQEVFTDPSYFGQILVATNAHIGNYGIKQSESESESIKIAGLVCRNFTDQFSRIGADSGIQDYFEGEGLVGISDVDTRAIVRHIRNCGAMNALISSTELDLEVLKQKLQAVPNMDGLELSSKVSTETVYELGDTTAKHKVAVLDLGTKKNILRNFVKRDCLVRVFPAKSTYAEMKSWGPAGYFISNGPGDPSSMPYAVETVRQILSEDNKVFGICLGHQILALACGIPTYKMHHGHRGINHPVKNLITGKCEVTSQNHGFGVSPKAIEACDKVEVTHVNLNDNTIEGIRVVNKEAFSIQYHPEAAPGPHDASYLFDQFVNLMIEIPVYTSSN